MLVSDETIRLVKVDKNVVIKKGTVSSALDDVDGLTPLVRRIYSDDAEFVDTLRIRTYKRGK